MKRAYLVAAALAGVAAGLFFALQGTSFDLAQYWSYLQSFWRRVMTKTNAIVVSDAHTRAIDLVASLEWFSAKAYPDADGYSIGYGHFIRSGDPYNAQSVISEEEGYALLEQDVAVAEQCVQRNVRVALTVGQQAALISFAYNIGCGAFHDSTLLRLLNDGDYDGAAAQFARWNKSQGQVLQALVERRQTELEVFQS